MDSDGTLHGRTAILSGTNAAGISLTTAGGIDMGGAIAIPSGKAFELEGLAGNSSIKYSAGQILIEADGSSVFRLDNTYATVVDNARLGTGTDRDFWTEYDTSTYPSNFQAWSSTGGGTEDAQIYGVNNGTTTVDFKGDISIADKLYLAPLDTDSWISATTNASGIVTDYVFRVNGTNKLWSSF